MKNAMRQEPSRIYASKKRETERGTRIYASKREENMCVKTRSRPSQKQIFQMVMGVVGKGKGERAGTGKGGR